jgi:hypothetical protein
MKMHKLTILTMQYNASWGKKFLCSLVTDCHMHLSTMGNVNGGIVAKTKPHIQWSLVNPDTLVPSKIVWINEAS